MQQQNMIELFESLTSDRYGTFGNLPRAVVDAEYKLHRCSDFAPNILATPLSTGVSQFQWAHQPKGHLAHRPPELTRAACECPKLRRRTIVHRQHRGAGQGAVRESLFDLLYLSAPIDAEKDPRRFGQFHQQSTLLENGLSIAHSRSLRRLWSFQEGPFPPPQLPSYATMIYSMKSLRVSGTEYSIRFSHCRMPQLQVPPRERKKKCRAQTKTNLAYSRDRQPPARPVEATGPTKYQGKINIINSTVIRDKRPMLAVVSCSALSEAAVVQQQIRRRFSTLVIFPSEKIGIIFNVTRKKRCSAHIPKISPVTNLEPMWKQSKQPLPLIDTAQGFCYSCQRFLETDYLPSLWHNLKLRDIEYKANKLTKLGPRKELLETVFIGFLNPLQLPNCGSYIHIHKMQALTYPIPESKLLKSAFFGHPPHISWGKYMHVVPQQLTPTAPYSSDETASSTTIWSSVEDPVLAMIVAHKDPARLLLQNST
eukprot:284818092_5